MKKVSEIVEMNCYNCKKYKYGTINGDSGYEECEVNFNCKIRTKIEWEAK